MRASITTSILILATVAAGVVRAQPMSDMKGMDMAPAGNTAAVKTGKATGVVKAIDARSGTVKLQHGPIPGVGWPAMTMTFKTTKPGMLSGLKVGQTVDFDVRTPPTGPEITALRAH